MHRQVLNSMVGTTTQVSMVPTDAMMIATMTAMTAVAEITHAAAEAEAARSGSAMARDLTEAEGEARSIIAHALAPNHARRDLAPNHPIRDLAPNHARRDLAQDLALKSPAEAKRLAKSHTRSQSLTRSQSHALISRTPVRLPSHAKK